MIVVESACVHPDVDLIPSKVCDLDAIAGLHFHAVLEPFARRIFIRHFAFEHGLFGSLHGQVGDALQNLQFLI